MDSLQALHLARQESIQAVDIKFTNLFGGLHHITVPAKALSTRFFENGLGFDGSSIPGFSQAGGSDLQLIPIPSTAWIDPFWEVKTLSFIGRICRTGSLEPFLYDPRQTAVKAEQYLLSTNIATESIWGPEFEFYIFDSINIYNEKHQAGYSIGSSEGGFGSYQNQSGSNNTIIQPKSGYHATPPKDRYYNLRQKMCDTADRAGIGIKYHHHEVGAPGQSEIEVISGPLLKIGDHAILLKHICKMVAKEAGKCVSFMPKPLFGEAGNGMHFHQQLFDGAKPVFYDKSGYAGLSQTALYYIGGLLRHAPALLGLTNPSTNSYKRLVPGFEAPVKGVFGLGNRAAAIRIPKYANEPNEKRLEFRPPDATCNIYLAMAAQLMAGIDGIINKIDPLEHGFGPFDTNLTDLPEAQKDAIPSLPTSLPDALNALKNDHHFLLMGGVFDEELIDRWIETKLRVDNFEIRNRPHPYELMLYFDA